MIRVYVKKSSNYPISTAKIKRHLKDFLKKKGIKSESDVYVYLVGIKKMIGLAGVYLGQKNSLHNVLSFPGSDVVGKFVYPPGDTIHLGDIYICYAKVVEEAKKENKLIEVKTFELIEHAALHLLGEHHE